MMKKKIQLTRIEMAILTVMFKAYPMGLTQKEIQTEIIKDNLLQMSEEEFEKYMKNAKLTKQN